MDKSDIEFLENGNVKIFGQEYSEGFFRTISGDINPDLHIYLTEENGLISFKSVPKTEVSIAGSHD